MSCKKGDKTNLQFPIFRISYPVCGKHNLDSIVRPRRNNKLMWRRRASYTSKVDGGQIKTIDVHELMYNNLKRKNISCHHGILQKQANVCAYNHQVEGHEKERKSCHLSVLVAIMV